MPDLCHTRNRAATLSKANRCAATVWRRDIEPSGDYSWAFTARRTGGRWEAVFAPFTDEPDAVLEPRCLWLGTQDHELVRLNRPPYKGTPKRPC
jgi:hypothetical protein